MSSTSAKSVLLLLIVCAMSGCRFKGWESFTSATTPAEKGTWAGDPGAYGGAASASGGLRTKTHLSGGPRENTTAPLNPAYDQPGMGSGQQPGDPTIEAAPGYVRANGPAFQNSPGDLSSPSTRSER